MCALTSHQMLSLTWYMTAEGTIAVVRCAINLGSSGNYLQLHLHADAVADLLIPKCRWTVQLPRRRRQHLRAVKGCQLVQGVSHASGRTKQQHAPGTTKVFVPTLFERL